MPTLIEDFDNRRSLLSPLRSSDAETRLSGFYNWMLSQPTINRVLESLASQVDLHSILMNAGNHTAPAASTPEEIAAVGIKLLQDCANGEKLFQLTWTYGVHPTYSTNSIQADVDEFLDRFINPAFDYVREKLDSLGELGTPSDLIRMKLADVIDQPFRSEFPMSALILDQIVSTLNEERQDYPWFNVANSCREALKKFVSELGTTREFVVDPATKGADVKTILKSFVLQVYSGGRYSETLCSMIEAVWDHVQSILHRDTTTKEEAVRALVWTCLLMLELKMLTAPDKSR